MKSFKFTVYEAASLYYKYEQPYMVVRMNFIYEESLHLRILVQKHISTGQSHMVK